MSDLLAPLMVIFDNEVDAFWGFVGFMNKVVSILTDDDLTPSVLLFPRLLGT